jgi:excisionase family DNA binding protein
MPLPVRAAYTVKEFAGRLSLHPSSVFRLIASGRVRAVHPTNTRAIRIPETELFRLLARSPRARRHSGGSDVPRRVRGRAAAGGT